MKKILTISVAAYNVQDYIERALDSLIIDEPEGLEVLIVNDGSRDRTLDIAKAYEKRYPGIFKVIDKDNGGYGSTINAGIDFASGKYFKQLDGDDWYNTKNLGEIIDILKNTDDDIVYTPYSLYLEKNNTEEVVRNEIEKYPKEPLIEESIIHAKPYLPMHSLMFKTSLLKDNNIRISEHCFYTDVEYAVYPFLFSKTIKVINKPLYVYRVGREGQSVSLDGRAKHYQDHIRVDEKMLNLLKSDLRLGNNTYGYLKDYFASIFASCVSNYLLILKPTKEHYRLILDYNNRVKRIDEDIYMKMGEKSGSVRRLRKSGFLNYKILHYFKLFKERIKGNH